jgi:hypothetical protein
MCNVKGCLEKKEKENKARRARCFKFVLSFYMFFFSLESKLTSLVDRLNQN